MKKLIVVALLLTGMATFAQEKSGDRRKAQVEKLTPEQRNQLHLKKMTLELGLDASQQKEMSTIIAEQNSKREAMTAERKAKKDPKVKLTADERFKKQNAVLDAQIAMKARVKKILTPQQYEKWETKMSQKRNKMKKHAGEHRRKALKSEDK